MGGAAGAETKYQFNGIEHVDAFDLNVNMAAYRTLDPVIGRWWGVDPKAESFMSLTPYSSMGNSPVLYNDPHGDAFSIPSAFIGAVIGGGATAVAVSQNQDMSRAERFGLIAAGTITGGLLGGFGNDIINAISSASNRGKSVNASKSSLDASHLIDNNPKFWKGIKSDLEFITGLKINANSSGKVGYRQSSRNLGGSRKARRLLVKAINSKSTIFVKDNPGGGSRVLMDTRSKILQNTIHLDALELQAFIDGTSSDLDSRTYGFGMNFFHEFGHTRTGGRKLDGGHMIAGPNLRSVNQIRKQLGPSFGKRMVYNQFVVTGAPRIEYHAFSRNTLRVLISGKIPNQGYIKIPR